MAIAVLGSGWNTHHMPVTMPAPQQHQQQDQQQSHGGRTQVGPKPPWDQQGYCWTHRNTVREGYTTATAAPTHVMVTNVQPRAPQVFPIANWCRLTEHCDYTLNMMHPCCQSPALLAFEAMEGSYSFDATPMAPPGTKVLVHVKPIQ